jgi:hypothetical protein
LIKLRPFLLGLREGREQPFDLITGVTYPDRNASESYDRGINVGQALACAVPVILSLGARSVDQQPATRVVRRETCYFCNRRWGECSCKWHKGGGFMWQGTLIDEPNVSECGRFYVDPEAYYGKAYLDWAGSM